MNNVVHFMRWCLPSTASFIRNQIIYHQRYIPAVVYCQPKKGEFYDDIHKRSATLFPLEPGLDRKFYGLTRQLTPAVKRRIITFVREVNPRVVHIHYGVDCLVFAGLLRTLKIPACVSFYGYDSAEFPGRFLGLGGVLLKKKVFDNPFVRAVLAMSEDMKADLLKAGCPEAKIIVHYYGIEAQRFFIRREIQEKSVVKFLIISGLFLKKGHAYLIEAFVQMTRSIDRNVELHIVGDGPLYQSIEDAIAQSGVFNIFLHGHVTYGSHEHKKYLRDADVFVHPSIVSANGDKEGIPGAVVEAMAAGLPVVSTYHAGIPAVIRNEVTGLLVPEKDVGALRTAMTRLATDRDLRTRIAGQGQMYALENLDINPKETELENIYDLISEANVKSSKP